MTLYDPPEGWMYGFPKEYKPLEGESVAETLRRDGYPERLLQQGLDKYTRFIGPPDDNLPIMDEFGTGG